VSFLFFTEMTISSFLPQEAKTAFLSQIAHIICDSACQDMVCTGRVMDTIHINLPESLEVFVS
jgi:hypothetical protein